MNEKKKSTPPKKRGKLDDKVKELNEMAKKVVEKNKIPLDFMGLTPGMVEGIYGQAYQLYNTGKYQDASQLFRMLVMINPTEYKFAMGLGACLHMMKNYLGAMETYTLCTVIDPENPIPYFHLSDCYIHLKNKASALRVLKSAVEKAGDKKNYQTLKERAAFNIKSLSKKTKK